VHEQNVRVKRKMKPPVGPLVGAIRRLRSLLHETQRGMAERLGVSLRAYSYWESGRRTPTGGWLARLSALALHDAGRDFQNAALFGDYAQDLREQSGVSGGKTKSAISHLAPLKTGDLGLLRAYNDLIMAAEVLFDVAAAGHPGARQELKALADRASRRAGDWQQAQNSFKKRKE